MIKKLSYKNNKCNSKKEYILMVLAALLSSAMLCACDKSDAAHELAKKIEDSNKVKEEREYSEVDNIIEQIENEDLTDNGYKDDNDIKVYSEDGNLVEPVITIVEYNDKGDTSSAEQIEKEEEPKSVDSLDIDPNMHNDCYAYSQLPSSEQKTYCEIYEILIDMTDDVVLSCKDPDEIDHAFKSVMVDYPELFYVKGYSIGKFMISDIIDRISFSGTYTMDRNEVIHKREEVENYITNVINNAPNGDDYSKIKYVYEYLIDNNSYDLSAPDNQNILSVVENGVTVCQGYAKMTQLLLNRMGLFCTLVNGSCKSSGSINFSTEEPGYEAHVWNIVKSDGKYYILDTTWGDTAFNLVDDENGEMPSIDINYEYFLVRDEDIALTHKAKAIVTMPQCNSLDDNYYVREGLYFNEINDYKITAAFEKAYANGDEYVCFKAANEYIYDELLNYLIDEQNVFNYINQSNVKYGAYPERKMLLFTI